MEEREVERGGRKEGGRKKRGGRRSKVSPFDSRQKKKEEEEKDVTFFSLSLSLCHFWERVN